ncbi:MAG: DNA repair protein RecO [Anaerolineae bacterium]|nr:DNA repair protein RecO [Anaerolineae bacterium]
MPREFRSVTVEAIVLKHLNWGEADRILTLFTRQQGKIRALGKSVRKIRSRRAGHLEPFTHVSLQLAKSRDIPIITQAETLNAFLPLRENLTAIGHASYVVELLDKFTYEEGENLSLFNLLVKTFERLAHVNLDPLLALRYYEMRLLDNVGFRPELFHCLSCGAEIKPEDQYFSPPGVGCCAQNVGGKQAGRSPFQKMPCAICATSSGAVFPRLPAPSPQPNSTRRWSACCRGILPMCWSGG